MFQQFFGVNLMKKFAINALAIAAGALSVGGALAGTITLPGGQHTFAVEALTPTTVITTPDIVYNMGVGRPIGNGFTIIMTPSAGSTFGTCVVPTYGGVGLLSTVSVTLKRQSATECAYDVQVAVNPVKVADTFTWLGQTFATHPLAVKGSNISVSINLKDPGETAQVDNPGPITQQIASSAQAINVYALTSDTFTVADVNATGGPLTGFVPDANAPSDSATQARAHLRFDHNSANRLNPDGVTLYTFSGTTALTLTGSTSGVATNGFCLNADNDVNMCEVGERFTVTPSAATFANATAAFGAQGSSVDRDVTFVADGTTQLGTARTFALSGTITPQLAGASANSLADTAGKNATAWVWSANASQLTTPFFTLNSLFLTRFYFLNTGASAVGYSATCFSEGGAAIVYGAGKTGTLGANGMTTVDARNVCSFATGTPRGSILFTINAPISTVKGSYQYIDQVSLNGANTPMTRPYNQANTTE
jgi:hypothetical protein